MVTVDTHCHASPYWYAPVESLLDEMTRAGVDKATLIQIGGIYDNSYFIECMRRFPGRFSVVGMVDTDRPTHPDRLEEWVKEGKWKASGWALQLAPREATPWPSGARPPSWG